MDKLKDFITKHFEKLLVAVIVLAALSASLLFKENFVLLNFYFLPALVAGYFLGRRMALLTAIFCILAVVLLAVVNPDSFMTKPGGAYLFALLAGWAGFLLLASIAVGTLYEENKKRIKDLKRAYIGVLEILSKYLEDTDRYTKGHSLRVSEMAMDIAIAMELPSASGVCFTTSERSRYRRSSFRRRQTSPTKKKPSSTPMPSAGQNF